MKEGFRDVGVMGMDDDDDNGGRAGVNEYTDSTSSPYRRPHRPHRLVRFPSGYGFGQCPMGEQCNADSTTWTVHPSLYFPLNTYDDFPP
jgi:hypothetical protein